MPLPACLPLYLTAFLALSWLPVSPSAVLSLSVCLSACLPASQPARLFLCLPVCLFLCLTVCPSACLPACLSLGLPASVSLRASQPPCLSLCLPARRSACPFLCLPASLRSTQGCISSRVAPSTEPSPPPSHNTPLLCNAKNTQPHLDH